MMTATRHNEPMNQYHATPVLRNLVQKKLLSLRLQRLFDPNAPEVEQLLRHLLKQEAIPFPTLEPYHEVLLTSGLLSETPDPKEKAWGSILFCCGVNFELTYRCRYRCPHCSQLGVRDSIRKELSTETVKQAITDAFMSGVCTTGINFTGGEPVGHRDDLLDIMEHTASLGIPFRMNTNGWWSNRRKLKFGDREFASPAALLETMKSSGLTMLALSHDSRYARGAMPMENLLFTIRLCEEVRMPYQLVFTEGSEMERLSAVMTLRLILDSDLELMQPVASELVDVGGAADFPPERFSRQLNIAPCQDKGFYRPHYLHVAPDGKVRSCMFAYGSSNVGDLTEEPLHAMLNRFPWSPIAAVFTNKQQKELACRHLLKRHEEGHTPLEHECTRNIKLERMLSFQDMTQQKPNSTGNRPRGTE